MQSIQNLIREFKVLIIMTTCGYVIMMTCYCVTILTCSHVIMIAGPHVGTYEVLIETIAVLSKKVR